LSDPTPLRSMISFYILHRRRAYAVELTRGSLFLLDVWSVSSIGATCRRNGICGRCVPHLCKDSKMRRRIPGSELHGFLKSSGVLQISDQIRSRDDRVVYQSFADPQGFLPSLLFHGYTTCADSHKAVAHRIWYYMSSREPLEFAYLDAKDIRDLGLKTSRCRQGQLSKIVQTTLQNCLAFCP